MKKDKFVLVGILLLGFFLRVFQFRNIPPGLYVDEAFAGYETSSILNTGADEWGVRLPVYFISSGSGQSVLYSYLSIPIILALGLSPFSVRLLSLLIGILALPLLFITVHRTISKDAALVSTFLLAIMPWHVMISRWALDANLLPFFLLFGIYMLSRTFASGSRVWLALSLFPLACSLYAYALAYIVVPVFLVLFFIVHRKATYANWKEWFVSIAAFIVMAMPIFFFLAKNFIVRGEPSVDSIFLFGIPLLPFNRLAHVSSPILDRLIKNFVFLAGGFQDGEVRNMVIGSPPAFLICFPLALVGCFFCFKLRDWSKQVTLFLLWLVACIPLFFISDLAINRVNAIFIPMLVVAVYGWIRLRALVSRNLSSRTMLDAGISALVILQATFFVFDYFLVYPTSPDTELAFFKGFDRAIARGIATAETSDEILVTNGIATPYILTAFYASYPPQKYQREIVYTLEHEAIQVKSFGRFYFGADNLPNDSGPVTYVLGKWDDVPCSSPRVFLETRLWQVGRCESR